MDRNEQQHLMGKFMDGRMSPEEISRFRELLHEQEGQEAWLELIGNTFKEIPEGNKEPVDVNAWFLELKSRINKASTAPVVTIPRKTSSFPRWGWVAAALVIALGTGWLFYRNNNEQQTPQIAEKQVDISPGKEGAILTLADGTQVVLDSLGNGVISTQNGTKVVLKDGLVAYDPQNQDGQAAFNSIATPKGRQFSILLPDGTRVWLNAASSLRYPTVFSGKERRVEVSGEAYFEVAHNEHQPFRLNINNQAEVEVLGTSFNVNAYTNENAISATLLEGKVKMTAPKGGEVLLRPGQQAQLQEGISSAISVHTEVDTDKVMAWKNGLFNFDGVGIEEVMRQLERWYDIEVVYEKGVPDIVFGGKLRKDVRLSGVLKSLEESEVHFRMEGRRLIVLP